MSIKCVITDYIEPDLQWESEELGKRGVDFAYYQLKFAPAAQVIEATRNADIVVVNMVPITREVIAGWQRCKLVIRHGTGYDNVDIPALSAAGIPLVYIPDYCTEEVAEQAISLLFACARRVVLGRKMLDESSARGSWDFTEIIPIFRMEGRTLGIVGCGRIGSTVHRKLKTFGFNFLCCDPYLSETRKQAIGEEFVDLETLLRRADFVTIHTLLTDETRHLINATTLSYMKPTAVLVNTARGPIVDAYALAEAIKSKTIAGAGIDVFDTEPPAPDYPLFGLANAVLTPHLAWYSEDAGWKIREIIITEIDRFIAGQPPRFTVNAGVH